MQRGNELRRGKRDLRTTRVQIRVGRLDRHAQRPHDGLGASPGVEPLEPVERFVAAESFDAENAHVSLGRGNGLERLETRAVQLPSDIA